jgi:hypothetical protein
MFVYGIKYKKLEFIPEHLAELKKYFNSVSIDFIIEVEDFDTSLFKVTKNIIGYDDDQCQGYLTSSQSKRYNGTTYKFVNIIYNKLFDKTVSGSTLYITASTPPWRSDSHQLIIDKQHISSNSLVSGSLTKVITTFISGGRSYRLYESASSSNDKSLGIKNHRYNGCNSWCVC